MQKITPCLWFNTNAEEAVKFYTSVFKNGKTTTVTHYDEESSKASGQPEGSVLTVEFDIEGQHFMALNGGPIFTINPSISFFVYCKTAQEVDTLWEKLSKGGKVMMELGEYPFSKRYGWVADKFGVSWQIMMSDQEQPQKIVPCMLFANNLFGKAAEALKYYLSIFPDSSEVFVQKAGPAPQYGNPEAIMYAMFTLCGEYFTLMDGPGKHAFAFSEGVSLVVNCDTQKEIDTYWSELTAEGGEEVQCGWLKDKYGVSWQITPTALDKMIADKEPAKAKRAMKAMLQMKKLDIKKLQEAFDGAA